jgi:hypothetical protein
MPPIDRAPPPSNDELDMMLAGGRLGGPAKDRIFEAVAGQVAPRKRPFNLRALLAAGLVVSGAAAALVLLPRPREDGFHTKGAGGDAPTLELSCAGGTMAACPVGARLLFAVEGADRGFLAAWADPAGGGERIWYFSRDGQAPVLTRAAGTQVAPKAILLGSEHRPGDYVVHVLVTSEALSRTQLGDDTPAIARRDFPLRVVSP